VADPAGDHPGRAAGPVPLNGDEGQMDVLAVAERRAGGGDLRQDRGEFRWQRPLLVAAVLVASVLAGELAV
jgi:hypothetical protein